MTKISLSIAIVIAGLIIASCRNDKMESKDIEASLEWQPGVSAPKEYPVEVYSGDLFSGETWCSLPNGGITSTPWGWGTGMMTTGHFVPDMLKITWLSFVENKFYEGEFKLPRDTIADLFKKGVMDYNLNKLRPYDNIVVGMAPGGMVVVWLSARPNLVVEVGRFQATETDMLWKHFNPNGEEDRNVYVNETIKERPVVVQNLEANGIQTEKYEAYRLKYNWRPIFIFPKGSGIEMNGMTMYNGEFIHLEGKLISENTFDMRALPKKMYWTWHDEKQNRFGADVYFDEEEVFKAFKAVFKEDRKQECELRFTLNETRDDFNVSLRNKTEEYELHKVDVRIFNKTKD